MVRIENYSSRAYINYSVNDWIEDNLRDWNNRNKNLLLIYKTDIWSEYAYASKAFKRRKAVQIRY